VMLTGKQPGQSAPASAHSTPVINYKKNKFGLRGINQIAEWGEKEGEDFVILGQSPSAMIEAEMILEKDPFKYYTDTSFRVAKDATSQ
jgi:eukaryotic-like serine/threonine-protein kinase